MGKIAIFILYYYCHPTKNNKDFKKYALSVERILYRKDEKPQSICRAACRGINMIDSRIKYIHQNPVKAGIVDKEEEYLYHRARNYYGLNALLEIDMI